jgi:hypothetical protein
MLASQTTMLRRVSAIEIAGLTPGEPTSQQPTIRWVEPNSLLVDEGYQRNLSKRSMSLIRQIVGNWDWRRFKPPIVAETELGLEVIDGQHTAIAAATHPFIAEVPVIVVKADERATRAGAFIGHNRDRISITSTQMYFAALTAGDEDAQTVQQVCERAEVVVLKHPPAAGEFSPGETMAVSAIARLIGRRGVIKAREVLEVVQKAELAPVSAAAIRATEELLFDAEFTGQIQPGEITMTLAALGDLAESEAKTFAATHRTPYWRAYASVIFRHRRRLGPRRIPDA